MTISSRLAFSDHLPFNHISFSVAKSVMPLFYLTLNTVVMLSRSVRILQVLCSRLLLKLSLQSGSLFFPLFKVFIFDSLSLVLRLEYKFFLSWQFPYNQHSLSKQIFIEFFLGIIYSVCWASVYSFSAGTVSSLRAERVSY